MRHRTVKRLTAATIASLALMGAACSEDTRDEMGDVGEEMQEDVEEGVENIDENVDVEVGDDAAE